MVHEFNTELAAQEEWGWLLALDLFFAGMGAALFLLFLMFDLPPFVALLSLGLVALGAVVLLVELGHPLRAWRALCKPFSSWISRGVICVTLFIVFGGLYSASGSDFLAWLAPQSEAARRAFGAIAAIAALFVILYPGFVLAASPSIPFWNSPLLPVFFLTHSLMVASGLVFLLSSSGLLSANLQGMNFLAVVLIVVNLALGAMYLAISRGSGLANRESVRRLNEGSLGLLFQGGAIFLGMIVPLVMVLWLPSVLALAGLCILIGGLLFRYCVLKAGVYVPFPLT